MYFASSVCSYEVIESGFLLDWSAVKVYVSHDDIVSEVVGYVLEECIWYWVPGSDIYCCYCDV